MNWPLYFALLALGLSIVALGACLTWRGRRAGAFVLIFFGEALIVAVLVSPLVPLLFFTPLPP